MLSLLNRMGSKTLIQLFQQRKYIEDIPIIFYQRHQQLIYQECLFFLYQKSTKKQWGIHCLDKLVSEIVFKILLQQAENTAEKIEEIIIQIAQNHLNVWEKQTVCIKNENTEAFTFLESKQGSVECIRLKRTDLSIKQLEQETRLAETILFEAVNQLGVIESACIYEFYFRNKNISVISNKYKRTEDQIWEYLKIAKCRLRQILIANLKQENEAEEPKASRKHYPQHIGQ